MSTAITETRTFSVKCARHITDGCLDTVTLDHGQDDVTSVASAATVLRDAGWRLHANGAASCPACMAAWDAGMPADEPVEADGWDPDA